MNMLEALLILLIVCTLLYIIHILSKKPKIAEEKIIVKSEITGNKYIIEPRAGAVGVAVINTKDPSKPVKNYLMLVVTPDVSVSAEKTWSVISKIKESVDRGIGLHGAQYPIRKIHFSEIVSSDWKYTDDYGNAFQLLPKRAYLVRVEIPDADKARAALDELLYIIQEESKKTKQAGLLPTYIPLALIVENYPELRVIPSPVELPPQPERKIILPALFEG